MASIKVTLDTRRPFKDGRSPIVFRLSAGNQSTSIKTGIKLYPQDWDGSKGKILKTHPEFGVLNLYIKEKLLDFEKRLLALSTENIRVIKEKLMDIEGNNSKSFRLFAQKEISNLKEQGRYGNASVYETALKRFIGVTGASILLKEISFNVISDFELTLLREGVGKNTIAIYMRQIRALLNLAIKKGLLDRADYPFYHYKIKTEKTICRAITIEELNFLWKYPIAENTLLWHSRNMFFLIFNLIGISFIDLLLLEQDSLQNDRIIYRRRKTGKLYSIKLTNGAKEIINLYRNPDSRYLVSYFNFDKVPNNKIREESGLRIKTCNTQLKKLGKQLKLPIALTTYVARYSWANIAKHLGYPKDQIAEALGHEYGNRVTGIYLDSYGNDVIDTMNENVCSVLKNN